MNQRSRLLIVLGAVLLPCSARAAEPTKLECIAANDDAQDLRRAGRLHDAREKLALCVSASCPGPVRDDCAQRLAEVNAATPSIVFEVKDARGNDLSDVRVKLDGQPFVDRIDGTARPMDPGSHRFVFDAADGAHAEQAIVVREKEKDRHVRVALGTADATPMASPNVEPAKLATSSATPPPTLALVAGGIGVAALAVGLIAGIVGNSKHSTLVGECQGNTCPPSAQGDLNGFHTLRTASTVGYVVGAVGVVGGVVLWIVSPSSKGSTGGVGVYAEPAALGLRGAF
jgi:hypothetical protein